MEIPADQIVGDRRAAQRVSARVRGRQAIIDYLPWIGLRDANFSQADVVTSELRLLNINSAGAIRPREDAGTTVEPLVFTSPDVAEIPVAEIQFGPDPAALLGAFEPLGEALTVAARVSGTVQSAFPDGPPEGIETEAAHLAKSAESLNVILVADADLLADRNWIQDRGLFGARFAVQTANNGDFTVNALDNLTGSQGLISLRGRGLTDRPFEVIEAMTRDAELQFRAKEQELLAEIEETQVKIRSLQNEEQESGVILTGAQQREIEDFRGTMIDLRQQLRGVQRSLREDVEGLQARIKALNIWAVPAVVGLFAIRLAAVRRARAARYHAAQSH